MNAYGVKPRADDCSRLAPLCGNFLPVLYPVVNKIGFNYTWPACRYLLKLCCPALQLIVDCV